jgi:microsomal epoxide hydrolase
MTNALVSTVCQPLTPCICLLRSQIPVNMLAAKDTPDESKLTASEKAAVARGVEWRKSGIGYNIEHGTRPSTIGHVLSSNPLALLAW